MDPNECLKGIEMALARKDHDAAIQGRMNLRWWLERGGSHERVNWPLFPLAADFVRFAPTSMSALDWVPYE